MRRALLTVIGLALVGSALAQTAAESAKFDPTRDAAKDIAAATTLARKQNKRVMLDVGGEWCIWCKRLNGLMESDQTIIKLLKDNYIVVKVNFSTENENKAVLSKYPPITTGYPHLFILDGKGKLIQDQDSGLLEEGDHHSPAKVIEFLKKWMPKALTTGTTK